MLHRLARALEHGAAHPGDGGADEERELAILAHSLSSSRPPSSPRAESRHRQAPPSTTAATPAVAAAAVRMAARRRRRRSPSTTRRRRRRHQRLLRSALAAEPFDARAVFSLLMRLVQQFSEAAVQSRGGQLATEQQARLMEQQLSQLRAVQGQVMQEQLAQLALAQRDTTIHELERQLAISRQASAPRRSTRRRRAEARRRIGMRSSYSWYATIVYRHTHSRPKRGHEGGRQKRATSWKAGGGQDSHRHGGRGRDELVAVAVAADGCCARLLLLEAAALGAPAAGTPPTVPPTTPTTTSTRAMIKNVSLARFVRW